MCNGYDQGAERKERGYGDVSQTAEGRAFDDLIRNPLIDIGAGVDNLVGSDSRSGVGLLLRNLKPDTYHNNDDDTPSTPKNDLTITPTTTTNLDARQGEIDPSLKKKKRNMNSLRIREDLPQTLVSPTSSQSSGTTNIIT